MALIETADVERVFRGLVTALAERDPARLSAALEVAEIYQQIIPYRTHRARLGFATNQDYETALLGLFAGLGGYASLEPVEAQEVLALEAASPNPDPTAIREFAGARVRLTAGWVREVLDGAKSFAPPPAPPPPTPPAPQPEPVPARGPAFVLEAEKPPAPPPPVTSSVTSCQHCGRPLPTDRAVVFCPYCGTTVGAAVCDRCGDHLQPDWQFCPRCGQAVRR